MQRTRVPGPVDTRAFPEIGSGQSVSAPIDFMLLVSNFPGTLGTYHPPCIDRGATAYACVFGRVDGGLPLLAGTPLSAKSARYHVSVLWLRRRV